MASTADRPTAGGGEAVPEVVPCPGLSSKHEAGNTVVLITGASRGIGEAMLTELLARPKHTVIALNRPSNVFSSQTSSGEPLSSIIHASSAFLLCHYTATMRASDISWLAGTLRQTHQIERIDVVIANAAMAEHPSLVLHTSWEEVETHMGTNLGGPVKLVQGLRGLLGLDQDENSTALPVSQLRQDAGHKGSTVVLVSTSMSSMGAPEPKYAPAFAYGASKAAVNYLSARLHVEYHEAPTNLCAFALHPGWVRTRMGVDAAREWGLSADTPPLSAAQSAAACLAVIDAATIEGHGGKFWAYDGKKMEW